MSCSRIWGIHFIILLLALLSGCTEKSSVKTAKSHSTTTLPSNSGYGPYKNEGLHRSDLTDEKVLKAMSRVPRHKFVSEALGRHAYGDGPLPIGKGQTISQPYIVAIMTQEAKIEAGQKILEIGTGSGYQAAVLAELKARVFTIEIVPELAKEASQRLKSLGYESVTVREGDGWKGWPEEAPFDAIIVTAAAPRLPDKLVEQLAEGGRMVIPLKKPETGDEILTVVKKSGDTIEQKELMYVRFVPMTGGE